MRTLTQRMFIATLTLAAFSTAVCVAADDDGFKTIFNGKDLTGWDGRPGFWEVKKDGGGAFIRGETTPENKAPGNTFLIWRGGKLRDFELKVSYRIHTGNNSGIQYRSKEVADWVVSGYQSEVENRLGKTGFLYHERGRGWLVDVGDFMEIGRDGKKQVVGICADQPTILGKTPYHTDKDWNAYHFLCRGNHVVHTLNGYHTVELIDYHVDENNPESLNQRCMEGVLALQIHGGSPMTVDFKDIAIRQIEEEFGEAKRLTYGSDLAGWKVSGDKGVWGVKALDDPGVEKSNRQTKIEGALTVLACAGGGRGSIAPAAELGENYIVRFQRRAGDGAADKGPFKSVLGWATYELTMRDSKALLTVNGAAADAGAAKLFITDGRFALPAAVRAEYRNIVLLPIK